MTALATELSQPLSALLAGISEVAADADCVVTDITLDSREVRAGACFFALTGTRHDGADYAADAARRGAAAVVCERRRADLALAVPLAEVRSLRAELGRIANRFFATPSGDVRVFAVTGTNGKTTVAHLIAQAVAVLDGDCGYIGTLGAGVPNALVATANTTPDVITTNRYLAQFRRQGIRATALEVSSHALEQDRIAGLHLSVAAFTNLGHDHLDYHGTRSVYAACKRRLFEHRPLQAAAINIDDDLGSEIAASLAADVDVWTCSTQSGTAARQARVRAETISCNAEGVRFELRAERRSHTVSSALLGRFNVDNLLLIAASLLAAGYDFEAVAATLGQLRAVPGRMELCGRSASGARVIVDYAHTPDALAAVLGTLRELAPRRLSVVFGCGGDRDASKRPLMGAVATRLADHVVVTSDNPRNEDEQAIATDILAGMSARDGVEVCLDRAAAIRTAIGSAQDGDIVLVAGKGHETTQERRGERRAFSDRALVGQLLAELRT